MGTIGSIIVCIGIEGAFDKRGGISDHFVKITHKKNASCPLVFFVPNAHFSLQKNSDVAFN